VGTDLRAPLELVVTDCRMPGMSGVAVVAHLTALRPGLPVGDADPEIVESLGARLAPTRFLGKPFTPGDLLACVRALLVGRE
jgi:DNA-binding response OmpR family regulator